MIENGGASEIRQPSRAVQGNGGGDDSRDRDLHGRVSAIEAHLKHLATKEDIKGLEALIANRESVLLRWLIGILSMSVIAVIAALIRTFMGAS